MQLSHAELILYARQIALADIGINGQLKLKQASVICIGAGGLGSPVLQYLAAAGVGTIGIVDDDVVEASNLQRQIIYSHHDIGKQKTLAAKEYLERINPYINIEIYSEKFTSQNASALIANYDIVADCTDNLANRYLTNAVCLAADKAFVFAGIWQHQGQCMLFHGNNGPCFYCLFPQGEPLPDCREAGVLGVLPGLLGTMQANLIIQHILQIQEMPIGRFISLNSFNLELRHYTIAKNPDCPACGLRRSAALTFSAGACPLNDIPAISVADLKRKLALNENFILLDVRSPEERRRYHIGGTLIPLPELFQRIAELSPLIPVIVYCHTDKRSYMAAKVLLEHQFVSVAYLKGGVKSWGDYQAVNTLDVQY